jgi:hypothetical protein
MFTLLSLNSAKSQKLLGIKSDEKGAVPVYKHLDRKCLVGWSVVIVKEPFVRPKFGPFLCTGL